MFLKKLFDVIRPKPHRSADVVGGELTAFDQTIDGHLSDAKKLGELLDGVKLLGQLSHGFTR